MHYSSSSILIIGIILLFVLVEVILKFSNKSNIKIGRIISILEPISSLFRWQCRYIPLYCVSITYFIVLGIPYILLSFGENDLSQFWYFLLITTTFIYFIFLLIWTGTANFYNSVESLYLEYRFGMKLDEKESMAFKPGKKHKLLRLVNLKMTSLIPLWVIIGLVGLGILCFSSLTTALNHSHNHFCQINEIPELAAFLDFYLWHFTDLIPQIKVAETLNWEVPFKYYDKVVSWLLLLFKSIMAFVVIARFYIWNKWRKESRIRKYLL